MANHEAVNVEAERQVRHFLAPLVPYLDSPTVNEVMINRHDRIFVEDRGVITQLNLHIPDVQVRATINAIMTINEKDPSKSPLMDAHLVGKRVAAVLPPVAVHGPVLAIRKLPQTSPTLEDYYERGDFDPIESDITRHDIDPVEQAHYESRASQGGLGLVEFLQWAMKTRRNIAMAGGTGVGKTTFGMALLHAIPHDQRIVTAEDTNELVLTQPNVVQLEANIDYQVRLSDLIRMTLRLRPDRVIVGEVRGGEIFALLRALNSGHSGGLFTLHADNATLALRTMETYLRESPDFRDSTVTERRENIISAVHYVIYQARRGNSRAPEQILGLGGQLNGDNYQLRNVYQRGVTSISPSLNPT